MTERTLTIAPDSGAQAGDGTGRDRAQTVQDFAVGIGIFLLAVAFVFSFVPTVITPFENAGGTSTAQADRIAATIVENASAGNQTNKINASVFDDGERYGGNSSSLAGPLGLRESSGTAIDHVNITVIDIDDIHKETPSPVTGSGDNYDEQVGASATRIVTTDGNTCRPACQLVVRVWE